MYDPRSLEDDIYQAAFLPDMWPVLLDRISRAIGAEGALLANVSDPQLPSFVSEGVSDLYSDFFSEGWAYDNSRTHALVNIPHRGFMSDAAYLDEDWMASQPIYRDFLWPRGFGYAAGTVLECPGPLAIAISIDKKRENGPVSSQDIAFLDHLRPHLSRAAVLANRLEFAKIEAALHALKIASIPAAIIQSDGKVLGTNFLFESFAGSISIGARDRLHFASEALNQFYQRFSTGGPVRPGKSFPLKATEKNPPAIVHFIPITGSVRQIFVQAAYFILITAANRTSLPNADLIKGLFDLTPTESRIAEKLALGLVISDIAIAEGTSMETVRKHVKSILGKAGMKSQRDFVATVSSIQSVAP